MIEYAFITLSEDLGATVRATRQKLGISQTELAQRSNTSQRFVSEFERGKQTAEIGKVLQLLTALDLKLCVTNARTLEDHRATIQDLVDQVAEDLQGGRPSKPRKKLADFLTEGTGAYV